MGTRHLNEHKPVSCPLFSVGWLPYSGTHIYLIERAGTLTI